MENESNLNTIIGANEFRFGRAKQHNLTFRCERESFVVFQVEMVSIAELSVDFLLLFQWGDVMFGASLFDEHFERALHIRQNSDSVPVFDRVDRKRNLISGLE